MLPQPNVNLFWFFDRIAQILCLNSRNDETNIPRCQGGHSVIKNMELGVWFWLGKDILGFFKKIDLDNSWGS